MTIFNRKNDKKSVDFSKRSEEEERVERLEREMRILETQLALLKIEKEEYDRVRRGSGR